MTKYSTVTRHLHVTGTCADSITFVVREDKAHELDAEMLAWELKRLLPSATYLRLKELLSRLDQLNQGRCND